MRVHFHIIIPPHLLCMMLAFFCIVSGGCAGRLGHFEVASGLSTGNIDGLLEEAEDTYTPGEDFQNSLTLARLHQMKGNWEKSIAFYNDALAILQDYESRAIVNIREIGAQAGMFTLSRGLKGYFGAGYERSLLHTFNSLNYLMLGNMPDSAVEMRKMEIRQERWLAEMQEIIKNLPLMKQSAHVGADSLPPGYTMRGVLASVAGRKALSNYQDAFSYALSAIVCAAAGDTNYASVSARRATALAPEASVVLDGRVDKKGKRHPLRAAPAQGQQDVILVVTVGICPSLYIERVRMPFPAIGYLVLDMPSYRPPQYIAQKVQVAAGGHAVPVRKLLHTDLLAYRTLWDQVRYETVAAITRAGLKASASAAAYAVAYSNRDLRPYSSLIGVAVTALTDLTTSLFDDNARNWDTLPNDGFLGRATLPAGSTLHFNVEGFTNEVTLPKDGNTVFVWASYVTPNQVRVSYVTK